MFVWVGWEVNVLRSFKPVLVTSFCSMPGFLLRFEVAGTNVSMAGTKDGGRTTIFACGAKLG